MIPFVVGIGLLAVVSGGPPTVPAAGLPAGPPVLAVAGTRLASDPCRESAYSHNGSRFTGTYRWWFSAGTVISPQACWYEQLFQNSSQFGWRIISSHQGEGA